MIDHVLPVIVPLNFVLGVFSKGKDGRTHAIRKERIIFLHIHDSKPIFPSFLAEKLEVKPISIPLCVYIILQNQLELPKSTIFSFFINTLYPLEDIHQISTLKPRIKLTIPYNSF